MSVVIILLLNMMVSSGLSLLQTVLCAPCTSVCVHVLIASLAGALGVGEQSRECDVHKG